MMTLRKTAYNVQEDNNNASLLKIPGVRRVIIGAIVFTLLLIYNSVAAQTPSKPKVYKEFNMELKLDYRGFYRDGQYLGQKQHYISGAAQPEYLMEWQKGKYVLKGVLFGRVDQYDKKRTHFDVRELYWQMVRNKWELSIGAKKIFWGVTESSHLVDIINQTDFVESYDGEQKLGEAMVHYSRVTKIGTFDAFYLPYFRKRVFPGTKGRLRTPFVLDGSKFEFQNDQKEFTPSFAGRWSHYIGKFDIGLSHFYGVGREPIIADFSTLKAVYGTINQTGLDVQATTGPWLWKLEAIARRNSIQDMNAVTAGFEYTFGNVKNSGIDIGVLGEYLYDDRDLLSLSGLQNDVFVATRIAFNDMQSTSILFGGFFDVERTSKLFRAEINRRVKNTWSVALEATIFKDIDPKEFLYVTRNDGFMQFAVSKFF